LLLLNRIHFPSGDQLPESSAKPGAVIRRRPRPSVLTTKRVPVSLSESVTRRNTILPPPGE